MMKTRKVLPTMILALTTLTIAAGPAPATWNAHLLSEDFFDAATYPYITFESREVVQISETQLVVRGPLSIKGEVRDVDLPVTILGVRDIPAEMQQMLGGITELASFETSLQIDRNDFDVGVGSWAATMVVGGEVRIDIAVEANR